LPPKFDDCDPISADVWAWAVENSSLFVDASYRSMGRLCDRIPRGDLRAVGIAAAARAVATTWNEDGKARRETYGYTAAKNAASAGSRRLYPSPGGMRNFGWKTSPALFGDWTPKPVPSDERDQYPERSVVDRLWDAFMELDSRRRMVLFRWLGIGGECQTTREIGGVIGTSREYVSQLIESSIETLRKTLGYRIAKPVRPLPNQPYRERCGRGAEMDVD
jgi:hypothetical protein